MRSESETRTFMAMGARRTRHATSPQGASGRARLRLLLVASAVGAVLATVLTGIHLTQAAGGASASVCNLGGYINCDAVNASRFADWWGVPVAYVALVFYILLGSMTLAEIRGHARPRAAAYARGLGAIAVLYSLYLAFVSAFLLQAFCLFCIGLYAVNLTIAGVGWWRGPRNARFFPALDRDVKILFGRWLAWPTYLAIFAVLAGGIATVTIGRASSDSKPGATIRDGAKSFSAATGHTDGAESAQLLVAVFSDFECPYCRRVSAALHRARDTFRDEARFVFKHFPLDPSCNDAIQHGGHDRACLAADAAVCAGEQGKFWAFEEAVFSRGVDEVDLAGSAREAGLDMMRWRVCRWSKRAREIVETDIADGRRLGVQSTPTFVIGDEVFTGALSARELSERIQQQLSARRQNTGGEG